MAKDLREIHLAEVDADCTPGYYNSYGDSNRRQDGNYNGGFPEYAEHMVTVQTNPEKYFSFT